MIYLDEFQKALGAFYYRHIPRMKELGVLFAANIVGDNIAATIENPEILDDLKRIIEKEIGSKFCDGNIECPVIIEYLADANKVN